MRIVAGQYRGKKLFTPEGKEVRPTSERAREAVFNILNSHLGSDYSAVHLADIFAGTGAFGLEALSRGAASVTLVDKDIWLLSKNVKIFAKEQSKIRIIKADALNLPRTGHKFNMVFMDAPYAKGLTEEVLKQLIKKEWLAENSLCIVEIRKDEHIDIPSEYEVLDERVYGLAKILFLDPKIAK